MTMFQDMMSFINSILVANKNLKELNDTLQKENLELKKERMEVKQ